MGGVVVAGLALVITAHAKPRGGPRPETTKPAIARPGAATAKPAGQASAPSGPIVPAGNEFADTLPTNTPATADQHLNHEQERRAEALAFFARGLLSEDNADNDAALDAFRQAFERDPANAELAVKIAFMLAQRNDPSGGIQVLKDAVKYAPKEPMPLIYLAQLYAKYLKKGDLGLRYAEQALALDPGFYPSYLAIWEIATGMGQAAKAQQILEKAAAAPSKDGQFWLNVASLHAQAYLKDDGTALSPDAVQKMNALFRKAAELSPSDAVTQAKVGNYFVDSRQIKECIPFYQAALRLRQPTDDDPALVNVGDKLGAALVEAARRDEAIAVLEQVTKDSPLRFESFEVLGKLYQDRGDLDQALTCYKQSLLIDASEPQNHLRVASMQLQMKRYDEAVETARAARKRFPGSIEATFYLANALSQAKKHADAMAVFAEAVAEFEKGHEELLDAKFYLAYGAAAERAGLTDKAAELLKKSIELDPNAAGQAYNYLGYMWIDRGEHLDEAGEMIKKALEMEPDNAAYLDSLGWYYHKKADDVKALQFLLKAESLTKPEDPTVMDHIGDTYQQLGKTAEALQYWQKSVALNGEDAKKIAEKIDAAKQKVSAVVPVKQAP
jgi:tetratricopeptide (TPR) repeat protein